VNHGAHLMAGQHDRGHDSAGITSGRSTPASNWLASQLSPTAAATFEFVQRCCFGLAHARTLSPPQTGKLLVWLRRRRSRVASRVL
jgi:hypothetical protein